MNILLPLNLFENILRLQGGADCSQNCILSVSLTVRKSKRELELTLVFVQSVVIEFPKQGRLQL